MVNLTQSQKKKYNAEIKLVQDAEKSALPSDYVRIARSCVEKYPADGLARLHYARALFMDKQYVLAVDHAEEALRRLPHNEKAAILLARIYLRHEMYEFASRVLKVAHKLHPRSAFIHWSFAEFYMKAQNGSQARKHFETALNLLQDDYFKELLSHDYALCLASMRENAKADEIWKKLEASSSQHHFYMRMRAGLGLHDLDSELADKLRGQLDDPTTTDPIRSSLLHMLGNMQDRAGKYELAFYSWIESRNLAGASTHDFISEEALQAIEFYDQDFLLTLAPYGHASAKPMFVVGMPRSGTTLAEQILAGHSKIAGLGEIGRFDRMDRRYITTYPKNSDQSHALNCAQNGELLKLAEDYLSFLEELAPGEYTYVVDKMPSQYRSLGLVFACFPNAKIIHCNRHPADSFVSSFQSQLRSSHRAYTHNQSKYASAYLAKEKVMAHWASIYPQNIFELRYETLIGNPKATVEAMLNFLGLEWQDSCLNFFNSDKPVQTSSRQQVKKEIYNTSLARWKRYDSHLDELFAALEAGGLTNLRT